MRQLLVLLAGGLLAIGGCNNGPEAETNGERQISVNITEVQPSTFKHFLNVQGNVESDKTISITPRVTATVERIHVRAGDQVSKGTVLAELDGEVTRTQIDEVQSQLKLAETRYERQQNLREENIGSEIQLLELETQVRSLENQLATLQEQYDNYTIRATIGGTVNNVMIKEGENIGPADPAFQIANSEALKVTAEISEYYINRVETTDSVRVELPSIDRELSKRIDVVSGVIDPANRTFGIEVYIPNIDGLVRPNMLAKLNINDFRRENALTVPINVIQQTNEEGFLFLAEETPEGWVARQQPVVTGNSYGDAIVVEEGLQAGDQVITVGYDNINDGDPLSVQDR
ncbi:RND family efflux transporter, MFP subunit [Fodinibius roseus]|uniref:RND family efflux transporter, MFP subunit n=1 Tax=Fodinibius roseus TaxID=1194090 RepID=A0A1M5GKN6_9BACT|nr:efflux RND transporter periplasmic adaptor subunit [Fodinibius roseus]SHG04091.1 RND family efflux transporter, MFP subunit [Fodinibius roseus]